MVGPDNGLSFSVEKKKELSSREKPQRNITCLLLTKEANLTKMHTARFQPCGVLEKENIETGKKIGGGAGSD